VFLLDEIISSLDGKEHDKFENLEQRILKTERDHDEETRVTYRAPQWHYTMAEQISIELMTNKSEVYNRAINSGLEIIRDEIGWSKMKSYFDMKFCLYGIIHYDLLPAEYILDHEENLWEEKIDIEDNPSGSLGDSIKVPVDKSILSEIEENYVDRSNIKRTKLIRIIITCGICESRFSGDRQNRYRDEVILSLKKAIDEGIEMVEVEFMKVLTSAFGILDSYDEEFLSMLDDFVEVMVSDRKEKAREIVDEMKENGE